MIGAVTALFLLAQFAKSYGAAVPESAGSPAATVTASTSTVYPSGTASTSTVYPSGTASTSTVYPSGTASTSTVYPSGTASTSTYQSAPSSGAGSGVSLCYWAPEGGNSSFSSSLPAVTVTVVPTTTWYNNQATTVYTTYATPSVVARAESSQFAYTTSAAIGGTTTASAYGAGSVVTASAAVPATTQYFSTIVYGNGTATAYPSAFSTSSVSGSVLVCQTTTAALPGGTGAAPLNGSADNVLDDGSTLKDNGALANAGQGVVAATTVFALLQYLMA